MRIMFRNILMKARWKSEAISQMALGQTSKTSEAAWHLATCHHSQILDRVFSSEFQGLPVRGMCRIISDWTLVSSQNLTCLKTFRGNGCWECISKMAKALHCRQPGDIQMGSHLNSVVYKILGTMWLLYGILSWKQWALSTQRIF